MNDGDDAEPSVRSSPTGHQRGFTLLEMMVVMVLIAGMALLAAGVMTGGVDRLRLDSSAKRVASELRHARARALATGTPQQFVIDPRARTWQSAEDRGGEIPAQLGVAFTGARELQPAEGIGAIVFFGDGASTGGRVQLSAGAAARNIDVAWLTGEVTMRRVEAGR
ncbi:type II secretion system protein GspH [Luteimonas aestuarii]|uniref:Type II secretion system protein H n=1 Tax=Luteimonas aestuarii TaxID=453837 RepID=A0A4R5TQP6_9GAMM|nr:GspH/FimT family pseudopilin [Luteimonas aestuarii]TDK20625.1 type II secretion system protein GspH [Luteimonas aestuarii]